MSIPTALFLIALVLAAVVQIRARGSDLTAWAVIAICVGLLWGAFG